MTPLLLILTTYTLLATCQRQIPAAPPPPNFNPLLANDLHFRGPGVFARITPSGTQYVASIVAHAFAAHFADASPPASRKINQTLKSLPTSIHLQNVELETLKLDPKFVTTLTDKGILKVRTTNISLSSSATISGDLNGSELNDPITIRTPFLTMDVSIKILRNSNGNPVLKLEQCSVQTQGIKMTTRSMKAADDGKLLADAIAKHSNQLFFDLICPRIQNIVANRINQRFALLSSKISLEDSKNFDIVQIIMKAEERMKRQNFRNRFAAPARRRNIVSHTARNARQLRQEATADSRILLVQPAHLRNMEMMRNRRGKRQPNADEKFNLLMSSFNFSRANSLMLDYAMLSMPTLTNRGIEIQTAGEVFETGHQTPFGAGPIFLPSRVTGDMLQIIVADFVPNSLMYHGHRIRLFDTRVDWNTPQFGSVMRTTCDLSTGSLFCIGDLFPALRDMLPDRNLAFLFSTLRAPAIIVQPEERGGIHFNLIGLIRVVSDRNEPVGEMEIRIDALMKMKLTPKSVKGKVTIEDIRFTSRTPHVLLQDELDDAGYLSREILQRMVNDILKQGIPIPIHPLFKLVKPKLSLSSRSLLLETNFLLNEHIIAQLTAEKLVA